MRLIDADEEIAWIRSKIENISNLNGSYYNGYKSALNMVLAVVESWHPSDVESGEFIHRRDCANKKERAL